MNLNAEIKKIMDTEIRALTGCYCLIYKTNRGNYMVHSLCEKEERDEIKSIMMDQFVNCVNDEVKKC